MVSEAETVAEGIRVVRPIRGDAVLVAISECGGAMVAVDEAAIRVGHNALARMGLYVELTSAVVWEALSQVSGDVVAILTGSGLKTPAA